MIVCVQITLKLVICKFSANNEDRVSIFSRVSKVARGHNLVSRYPMKGWHPLREILRVHVAGTCSSCDILVFTKTVCCMKFNWFEFMRHKVGTKWPQFWMFQHVYCFCKLFRLRHKNEPIRCIRLVCNQLRTVPATYVLCQPRSRGFSWERGWSCGTHERGLSPLHVP